jgi:arsenate reductase (thioredoxin)
LLWKEISSREYGNGMLERRGAYWGKLRIAVRVAGVARPVAESGERAPLEVDMACGSYSGAERSELPQLATDASLGCGNPVALATLSPGEVVLDLGSGGGIYPTAAFEDAAICVREFERYFDAGQSKVSYHLGKPKEARLVHEERRGKWGFYSLDPTAAGLFRGMARDRFEVLSAGTEATRDKPEAILVMAEIGVDISAQESETLDRYLRRIPGSRHRRLRRRERGLSGLRGSKRAPALVFPDPSKAAGGHEERLRAFRSVKDEIRAPIEGELAKSGV